MDIGAAMGVTSGYSNPARVALGLATATILGALASEILGGLAPCELCLTQRLPYYFGIPILLASLLAPAKSVRVGLRLCALAFFLWGTYLGVYHAGVEWKLSAGPTACTGTGSDFSFDALANLNDARFVPCDQVQFRFLGLSLAGWNAGLSLLISVLVGVSLGLHDKAGAEPTLETQL